MPVFLREECNKLEKVLYQSVDKELELNQVIPQFTLNNVCGKSNQFINEMKSHSLKKQIIQNQHDQQI